MAAVVDSAPIILLSTVRQLDLLRIYFTEILVVPEVEREVITEGQGRPGQKELGGALGAGWARISPVRNQGLLGRLRRPGSVGSRQCGDCLRNRERADHRGC